MPATYGWQKPFFARFKTGGGSAPKHNTYGEAYAGLVGDVGGPLHIGFYDPEVKNYYSYKYGPRWLFLDRPQGEPGAKVKGWIDRYQFAGWTCPEGYILDNSNKYCNRDYSIDLPSTEEYKIKISPVTAPPYKTYLASLEPKLLNGAKSTVKLIAEVTDCEDKPANISVELKVTAIENTGGHVQAHHKSRNPSQSGKLKVGNIEGSVVSVKINGIQEFSFSSPHASGDHKIEATCKDLGCTQIGKDLLWVGIKDLKPLPASDLYKFIGETKAHPVNTNHYLSDLASKKINNIAFVYSEDFPDDYVLHLNDASLERGGLFDVSGEWKNPHVTHNKGTDIDIRSNEFVGKTPGDIPKRNYKDFYRISKRHGCLAVREFADQPKEHFHLYCNEKYGKAE